MEGAHRLNINYELDYLIEGAILTLAPLLFFPCLAHHIERLGVLKYELKFIDGYCCTMVYSFSFHLPQCRQCLGSLSPNECVR